MTFKSAKQRRWFYYVYATSPKTNERVRFLPLAEQLKDTIKTLKTMKYKNIKVAKL